MVAPPNPPFVGPAAHDSGSGNKPIRRIVLHSTVSPCKPGQARNTAAYFRSSGSGGSAHYIVDPSETVQAVWDSRIAWHAPPNGNSIGVEMCEYPGVSEGQKFSAKRWTKDKNHALMLARVSKLVARLCLAYDVPMRKIGPSQLRAGKQGVCGHIDVSRAFGQSSHWDPGNFPWRKFMRMVRRDAKRIQRGGKHKAPRNNPGPAPAPVPAPPAETPAEERTPREAREDRQELRARAAGEANDGRVDRARALIRIAANQAAERGNKARARRLREWLDAGPKH